MRLILAPWEVATDPISGVVRWSPPAGATASLDLRSNTQCAIAPGSVDPTLNGLGLFAVDVLPAVVAADLGDDPLARMKAGDRNSLADALGLPRAALQDATLAAILAEQVMGEYSDGAGAARVKPLRMNRRGAEMHLPGFGRLWHAPLDTAHPIYAKTLECRRHDYDRAKARGVPLDVLQKWTGWDMRALAAKEDDLLPARHRADGSRKPSTTLTESWPTNSSTISSGQDNPWTEDDGNIEVTSGRAQAVTLDDDSLASCDTSLSSDDHYHSASVTKGAVSDLYLACRVNPGLVSAVDWYALHRRGASGTPCRVQKRVAGSVTDIVTDTTVSTGTQTCTIQANGSSIQGQVAATVLGPVTDTSVTGYLKCAFQLSVFTGGSLSANYMDSHTMEDLAVATGSPWYQRLHSQVR